ncbi:MAG: hypothetical protein ACREFW_09460 [Rhizomicrobium sp.]
MPVMNPDAWTAAATVIIALFTVALAWASWRQARMTRETISLARDEFQATHRPRIIARTFRTLEETGPGDASITFVYVNVGDLPAKVVEIRTYVGVGHVSRADPAFKTAKLAVMLESGDKEIHRVEPGGDFHFARGFGGDEGNGGGVLRRTDAYILGTIIYEDDKGRRRETGFSRVSAGATGPWMSVKDCEYEYQD